MRVLFRSDQVEQLIDPSSHAVALPSEQPGDGGHVVSDGEVREQPDLLDDVADAAPQLHRVEGQHVLVVEVDVPRGRLDEAVHHPHGGGLAAPGGTDQDADLAVGHLKAEAVRSEETTYEHQELMGKRTN